MLHEREKVREQSTYSSLYAQVSPLGHLFTTRLLRVAELLGEFRGAPVLDVGCGPGMMADQLLARDCSYFAVDLAPEMIHECRARSGHSDQAHFDIAEVKHLPFSDHSFQVVLALGVLEYVDDLDAAIHEISRVLVPGGAVILSMQNALSIYRLWQRYGYHNDRLLKPLRLMAHRTGPGPLLETAASFRHMRAVLVHNHLEIEDVVFYDFNLWVEPLDRFFPKLSIATSRRLERLGRSPLRSLGADFIIKATLH